MEAIQRAEVGVEIDKIETGHGAAPGDLVSREPSRKQYGGHAGNVGPMSRTRDAIISDAKRFAFRVGSLENHLKSAAAAAHLTDQKNHFEQRLIRKSVVRGKR